MSETTENPTPETSASEVAITAPAESGTFKPPAGRPIDLTPTPILPGDTGQLIIQLTSRAEIAGVIVEEPGIIMQIIGGPHRHPIKEKGKPDDGTWEDFLGKTVPGGAHLIVIVKNPTDNMKVFNGVVYVTNEERPPAKKAVIQGTGPGSGARRHTGVVPANEQPRPTGVSQPLRGKGVVVPGVNEVAILMKRGNAERLLAMVKGGAPVYDAEKPAIILELERGLGKR